MKLHSLAAAALLFGTFHASAQAAEYEIDPAHSFVEFRIKHLGFSWLYGRFNDVNGSYTYDAENPQSSRINVEIDPASVDTNHAERDKDIRSENFLDVEEYSSASFTSTAYSGTAEKGVLEGDLTLHGDTRPVSIEIRKIGEGEDPWGGYRTGFIGTTTINRKDFGVDGDLGPSGWEVELELGIEGIRQ